MGIEVGMWKRYEVELKFWDKFAASLPKTREEINAMLEHRQPARKPEDAKPITAIADEVAEAVDANEEEPEFGYATFCKDENGLYYEGRCVRGHLKDCANQVRDILGIKALKAKVANKVYVETDRIYLGKAEPDGNEQRFVQVLTPKGPRSTIKYIDYVVQPTLKFVLKVFNDNVITEDILKGIFEYGGVHGMGQERSQDFGRYELVSLTELN